MLLKEKYIINFLTEKNETNRVKEVLIEIARHSKENGSYIRPSFLSLVLVITHIVKIQIFFKKNNA